MALFLLNRLKQSILNRANPEQRQTWAIYGFLAKNIKPYWFRAVVSAVITIPIGMLDAAIAFVLKPYVDGMQHAQSIYPVEVIPLVIVGFTLIQGLLNYTSIYLNGWLGFKIMSDLRAQLFAQLQRMDVSYFHHTTAGTIIQAYFRDPEALQANVLNNTKDMLTRLFSSLFLMSVLVSISWKLSIVAISVLLFVLLPSTKIRKRIKQFARNSNLMSGDILSYYTETAGGVQVIYGFNLQKFRMNRFQNAQKALFSQTMKHIKAQGWLTPSMHTIASVGVGIIIWQGSVEVVHHHLTTGAFVSFIAAMLMLYNPIKNLGGSMMNAQMSLFAAGRIHDLLNIRPAIQDGPDAKILDDIRQGISLSNVSFGYLPGQKVLSQLNLTIHRGETVALVGSSGCGKTTMASLLMRFYDVTDGVITIDGQDIRSFTMDSLRAQIALVTQDNFLFDGTIRDNLLVGKRNATDAELWDALEQAYLRPFIESLEHGLLTPIGERGVMLSGGQRQRMAIARALLKNTPIVILDEATSALDNESEAIVQQAMDRLMQDRTVLVIAHRLSTIRNADRIVVMDAGQVLEQGSHEELLAANGRYSMLYHTQFRNLEAPSTLAAAI